MASRKGQFKKGGGRVGGSTHRRRRRGSTHNTHRGRSMAKRTTVPIGLVAGMLPGVTRSFNVFQSKGAQSGANEALAIYTGFDPQTRQWSIQNMQFGLIPLIAGLLLSRFVGGGLGINRMLARARVPLLRI